MIPLEALIEEYIQELIKCGQATSLEQLQEAYTNVSSTRDELYEYMAEMYSDDEEQFHLELANLMDKETETTVKYPFPIFDEELDEVALFEDYTTYFQRYGCMEVDNILSWDENNILFHDLESDLVEIIQRPDVLMRGA